MKKSAYRSKGSSGSLFSISAFFIWSTVDGDNTNKGSCLALLNPSRRNWFRISRLVTMIAIGLRNPYAKSETGAGLVLV
jgi:hypothetical protein